MDHIKKHSCLEPVEESKGKYCQLLNCRVDDEQTKVDNYMGVITFRYGTKPKGSRESCGTISKPSLRKQSKALISIQKQWRDYIYNKKGIRQIARSL